MNFLKKGRNLIGWDGSGEKKWCHRGERSGVIKWHQTTSLFITEPKVYGREIDNDKIVEFFVNVASHSEDLFVYSIIGLGGLGKTTLAQLIFNYEKAVNHISEGFSLKRMEKATIEQYLGVLARIWI